MMLTLRPRASRTAIAVLVCLPLAIVLGYGAAKAEPMIVVLAAALLAGAGGAAAARFMLPAVLFGLLTLRMFSDGLAGSDAFQRGGPLSAMIGVALLVLTALDAMRPDSFLWRRPSLLYLAWVAAFTSLGFIVFGVHPALVREAARSVTILAVVVLAARVGSGVGTSRALRIITAIAVVGTIAVALDGVSRYPSVINDAASRARGFFPHPSIAAMVACLALIMLLSIRSSRHVWLTRIALVLCFVALLATKLIGALVALAVALALFPPMAIGRRPSVYRRRMVVLGAAAALLFVLTPAGQARVAELRQTESFSTAAEGEISNSLDWRYLAWSDALDNWRDRPVLGAGLGSTTDTDLLAVQGTITHNEVIRLLVETGLVGAALAGLAGFVLLRTAMRRTTSGPGTESVPMTTVLVYLAVLSLTENVLLHTAGIFIVAALLGIWWAERDRRTGATDTSFGAVDTTRLQHRPRVVGLHVRSGG